MRKATTYLAIEVILGEDGGACGSQDGSVDECDEE
jgi:hypothetical protein